ncbi:MAG: hypothetical protein KDH88_01670 [Chromatiales bacterium]|nr:hypothetical protein [Chromatiales bacterium]
MPTPPATASPPASDVRTAVILVHGVGDPNPGDALSDFTAALRSESPDGFSVSAVQIMPLEDLSQPRDAPLKSFFPMPYCEGTLHGQPAVFAEVFWGHVGKLPATVVGVAKGTLNLIFGLQTIIEGNHCNGTAKHWEDRLITEVGTVGALTLRGPVFALNTLMLMAALVLGVGTLIWHEGGDWPDAATWALPVVAIGSALTAAIGTWMLRRAYKPKDYLAARSARENLLFGLCCWVFALYWPLAGHYLADPCWEQWAEQIALPLVLAFSLVAVCLFFTVTVYLIIRLYARFRVWRIDRHRVRTLTAKTLALALQFGLWALAMPLVWLMLFGAYAKLSDDNGQRVDTLMQIFRNVVPSDGLQWLTTAVVIVAGLITWGRRLLKDRPPRLIVGALIEFSILITCAGAIVISTLMYTQAAGTSPGCVDATLAVQAKTATSNGTGFWLLDWIRDHELVMAWSVALAFTMSFFITGVRLALDIANDVVNYLSFNLASFRKRQRSADDADLEIRRPIRGKFNAVLRHIAKTHGQLERLIIISHSQGTVLVLDEFRESDLNAQRQWLDGIDVRLVTMGSPIAHLYQYYFPDAYPPWDNDAWDCFYARVDRWLNIFRRDDFVGTSMMTDPDSPAPLTDFDEKRVGWKGGHTNYWRDKTVIAELLNPGNRIL